MSFSALELSAEKLPYPQSPDSKLDFRLNEFAPPHQPWGCHLANSVNGTIRGCGVVLNSWLSMSPHPLSYQVRVALPSSLQGIGPLLALPIYPLQPCLSLSRWLGP